MEINLLQQFLTMKNSLWNHGDIFYFKRCRIQTFNKSRQCTESTNRAGFYVSGHSGLAERWCFVVNSEFLKHCHFYMALLTFVLERNPRLKVKSFATSQPSIFVFQSVPIATVSVSLPASATARISLESSLQLPFTKLS